MIESLPQSAQYIQDLLIEKGFTNKVIQLEQSTRTALDAAKTLNCQIEHIVKSLIFKTTLNETILILASGPQRVDEKIIEDHLGQKIMRADAQFVKEITGFAIGGVPPFGHKNKINHIFFDETLLLYDILWAAAGTPHAVFSLYSTQLQDLTNGNDMKIN